MLTALRLLLLAVCPNHTASSYQTKVSVFCRTVLYWMFNSKSSNDMGVMPLSARIPLIAPRISIAVAYRHGFPFSALRYVEYETVNRFAIPSSVNPNDLRMRSSPVSRSSSEKSSRTTSVLGLRILSDLGFVTFFFRSSGISLVSRTFVSGAPDPISFFIQYSSLSNVGRYPSTVSSISSLGDKPYCFSSANQRYLGRPRFLLLICCPNRLSIFPAQPT